MAEMKPVSVKNLDGYRSPILPWARARESLEAIATLGPVDPAGRYWLATVRPDGRLHVMPVGAVWVDVNPRYPRPRRAAGDDEGCVQGCLERPGERLHGR